MLFSLISYAFVFFFQYRFISVPKDMGSFNCGAFVAGIVRGVLDNAGFPAVVTAHFVPVDGQQRPRTTILIKFSEEVRYYIIYPFV
ncbi:putative transport protein particle (TRAPP) component [Helianthus anomalus]